MYIHRQCLNEKQLEKASLVHVQETIGHIKSITCEFHKHVFITHVDLHLFLFSYRKAALHQNPGPVRLISSSVELPNDVFIYGNFSM